MCSELREQRRGGGIIVYVKICHRFHKLNNINFKYCESLIIKIKTPHCYTAHICALYRPPNKSKHLFITELKYILRNNSFKSADLYLLGDINIDLKLQNNIRDHYTSCLAECGLMNAISDYTRIETRDGIVTMSCIDHIFARSRSLDLYSAALGTVMADHRMCILSCAGILTSNHIQADANTKQLIDYRKLKPLLENVEWNKVEKMECPNKIYNFIKTNFENCYNQSKYTIKNHTSSKRNKEQWINNKINILCQKRDSLYNKWKKDSSNKILKLEYNKQRNKTRKAIENSRNRYYNNEINKNKNNPRKLWQILNSLTGRANKSIDDAILKAFQKNQLTVTQLANNFAREFDNNVKKILPHCKNIIINKSIYTFPENRSMFFKPANYSSVSKIIKKLNTHKSAGADSIRCIDIKLLCDKITTAIVRLINTSVRTGIYPSQLKLGIVRPIYKKGNHSDFENYRPITILPVIDKIVEKYICTQIHNFYSSYDVLSSVQYGFQKNKSTTSLLDKFTDEINNYLNDKQHVILLFIDFSKAFDTLKHETLIQKLDNTGVRGPLLKWCKNYLKDRKYQVKIDNELSDAITISTGTAQGSVIGPLHYLAYVNDMHNIIDNCSVYQYADDTCLVVANKDLLKAISILQNDFTNLCKWSHDAGLVINTSKTKVIHVRSNYFSNVAQHIRIVAHSHDCLHKAVPVSNNCNCDQLEQVTHYKYLGLIVDEKFNWSQHIEFISTKLRAMLAKFAILKYKVPFPVLVNLYNAIAESLISYGITSYGKTFKTYLDKIYILQLKILKLIIPKNVERRLRCEGKTIGIFKYCKILPVHTKFKMVLLIEHFHKKDLQTRIAHNVTTRSITNRKLIIPKVHNYYGKRTNKYLIPTLMNEIPPTILAEIDDENCKHKFKRYYYDILQNT